MSPPVVSCLMATHGRHSWAEDALAYYCWQTWPHRELVILNTHPVALRIDRELAARERIRIINRTDLDNIGHIRNVLLQEARGEFVRTHDDDDIYYPWAIAQGVEHIGDADAVKPARSWFADYTAGRVALVSNALEASVTWRKSAIVRAGGYGHTPGDEHAPLRAHILVREVDVLPSYCYTWGTGLWHLSGSMGDGRGDDVRSQEWREHNVEVRPDGMLRPSRERALARATEVLALAREDGSTDEAQVAAACLAEMCRDG